MHCNTQLLEKKIKESGLKISFICERLGLSTSGFDKKRKGINPFRRLEIQELQKLLNLSDTEVKEIFLI